LLFNLFNEQHEPLEVKLVYNAMKSFKQKVPSISFRAFKYNFDWKQNYILLYPYLDPTQKAVTRFFFALIKVCQTYTSSEALWQWRWPLALLDIFLDIREKKKCLLSSTKFYCLILFKIAWKASRPMSPANPHGFF
jgi:hypothetical protein